MSSFRATNPATGALIDPEFVSTSIEALDLAVRSAAEAFIDYGRRSGSEKATFLRAIAAELELRAPALVARAQLETALPAGRLQGETARTANQLRMFADLVQEGSWVDARLDRALDRENAPRKPDLRSMFRPLGPVAVFGASNFPLAFSVAGGDTASALAAGCPVLVKAHPAHPGTSALAGEAIAAAVRSCGLPAGVFHLLFDAGVDVGIALVQHPMVRAVGFTGSLAAGRHLMDLAATRPQPIPVFAEMSSANPVFILPRALATRGAEIAVGLHASMTLGAGQFCTKPGIVVIPQQGAARLLEPLADIVRQSANYTLLTPGIAGAYHAGSSARAARPGVATLAASSDAPTAARVFQVGLSQFLDDRTLTQELFGPSTIVVTVSDKAALLRAAEALQGHLTATVHGTDEDLEEYSSLVPVLERNAGRVIINGFPTGVEVTPAMVHAGPYPAASNAATSVGTRAIYRFTRAVCYQDVPETLLPPELLDANPLGICRQLDGKLTREPRRRLYRARRRRAATPAAN